MFFANDPSAYRTRLIVHTLIPTFVLPVLVTTLFLQRVYPDVALLFLLIAQLFSIPAWGAITVRYGQYQQRKLADSLNAQIIPRVRGRWPGNLDIMLNMIKAAKERYLHDPYEDLFEEYKSNTLNLGFLWGDFIITKDEEVVKYVLTTGHDHFGHGSRVKEILARFLGDGIFNSDREIWKFHRSMTRPFFLKERISDFENFEHHTSRTLSVLRALGPIPIDVQDLFGRFTIDAASSFLFGSSLETLSMPLPKAGEAKMGPKGSSASGEFGDFAQAFEEAQQVVTLRARSGNLWPAIEFFGDRLSPSIKAMDSFLGPMVENTLKENRMAAARGVKKSTDETNLLEYMAANTDDPKIIRDELLNILLAGRDTTAALITFTVYALALHPHVLERAREEIVSKCPPGTVPSFDDLKTFKYLRAVLNEVLRLYPPVPIILRASTSGATAIPRTTTADGTLRKPYFIPSKANVAFSSFLLHRRKDRWGQDAEEFDPDRWLDSRVEHMVKNPFIFVPFNAGPRICIGQQFALNEASFFLVRLLQEYDSFELTPEYQPEGSQPPAGWYRGRGRAAVEKVWFASAMTLFAKGGLWLRFGKATI
ncbi:cytochrome P450 monooxygenase CYP63 [Sistotremastrum suecicum HHB10207 ss-3]|uniref:Cytochrome P450 monooxygenase CYP63 n=1 Tax=Sistotremastrum suecicum HHB10207 ss-3 TaxID=1314776 RepID=A0A166CYN3_9AGAM|nr:cytochrome P450 monooxygenase CYP63 [Sistotremastrum suecicum HHB10207 ss-3]